MPRNKATTTIDDEDNQVPEITELSQDLDVQQSQLLKRQEALEQRDASYL